MNLIDRDKLLEVLTPKGIFEGMWQPTTTKNMAELVKGFPSVDIVQCKDCRYRYNAKFLDKTYLVCDFMRVMVDEDGFCYKGERDGKRPKDSH